MSEQGGESDRSICISFFIELYAENFEKLKYYAHPFVLSPTFGLVPLSKRLILRGCFPSLKSGGPFVVTACVIMRLLQSVPIKIEYKSKISI